MLLIFCIFYRHNVKGSLAVMIGAFGSNTQIIKIEDYNMHPKNNIDPRHENFAKYNIALAKLACRYRLFLYLKIYKLNSILFFNFLHKYLNLHLI
jgi:hypothetical protein